MPADYDQLFQPPEGNDPPEAAVPQRNGHAAGHEADPHQQASSGAATPRPAKSKAPPPMPIGTPVRPAPEPAPPADPAPTRPSPPQQTRHSRHARGRADIEPARQRPDPEGPNARTTPLGRARRRQSDVTERIDDPDRISRRANRALKDIDPGEKKSSTKMVPRRGWRRWLYALTRINAGLSPDERHELELRSRVRRSPRGSYQIAVLGLKGGAGKTVVTVTLGSVLAQVRGDRILAVDANAGSGDLGERVGRQSSASIADLLANHRLAHYNDVRALTSINDVNLEVLAAPDYSEARRALNDQDWRAAVDTLSRFYNLVLADCGSNFFASATTGVLSTVSGAVIVASASVDGARQAAITIDWLRHNGFQTLLDRSCIVVNQVVPGEPDTAVAALVDRFAPHVKPGRVVVLPWDKHIAAGSDIEFEQLGRTYRRRVLELAAALSDDFERVAVR